MARCSDRRTILHLLVAAGLVALTVPGCGGGGDSGDRAAPAITNPLVQPGSLTFRGGNVSLTAQVADNVSVTRVWARITGPGVAGTEVNLAAGAVVPGATTPATYSATWKAPANAKVGGGAAVYTVVLNAIDPSQNVGTAPPASVGVAPMEAPPAAPPF